MRSENPQESTLRMATRQLFVRAYVRTYVRAHARVVPVVPIWGCPNSLGRPLHAHGQVPFGLEFVEKHRPSCPTRVLQWRGGLISSRQRSFPLPRAISPGPRTTQTSPQRRPRQRQPATLHRPPQRAIPMESEPAQTRTRTSPRRRAHARGGGGRCRLRRGRSMACPGRGAIFVVCS